MVRGFDLLGGGIKSIQKGIVTFANTLDTVRDVSISSVNVSKSIVLLSYTSSETAGKLAAFQGYLYSSNIVRIQRGEGYTGGTFEVAYTVIEFDNSFIVQTGEVVLSSYETEKTVSISSVNLSKSFIVASNNIKITSESSVPVAKIYYAKFNSATQLYFQYNYSTGVKYLRWYVVQCP